MQVFGKRNERRFLRPINKDTPILPSPVQSVSGSNVSRQLARLMGGDLTYRYEDGVSTFALTLPSAESIGEATSPTATALAS